MKQRKGLRQILVLTPDEKKAVACVLAAFFLGLATMSYRAAHPRLSPPPTPQEQYVAQRAARAADALARSARGRGAAPPSHTSLPEGDDAED